MLREVHCSGAELSAFLTLIAAAFFGAIGILALSPTAATKFGGFLQRHGKALEAYRAGLAKEPVYPALWDKNDESDEAQAQMDEWWDRINGHGDH